MFLINAPKKFYPLFGSVGFGVEKLLLEQVWRIFQSGAITSNLCTMLLPSWPNGVTTMQPLAGP